MHLIQSLTARYCLRQDARSFIELWALSIALAGTVVAIYLSRRHRMADRNQRRVVLTSTAILTCFAALTLALGLAIFRWCYESAAATLGVILPDASGNLDFMSCLNLHALETADGWIVIVVSGIVAIGLLALAMFRLKGRVRRALTFIAGAAALFFAVGNVGLVLFGISWCQSSRLF